MSKFARNYASIIIPVKNGGPLFETVCCMVANQEYSPGFSVLCIDSGSTDGSQDVVKKYGFELLEILPSEFGHGKTRNLGAAETYGEFIVFLTHDAIPATTSWLKELTEPLREDSMIAGAFSKHIAHDNADPFIAWELETHFHNLEDYPVCSKEAEAKYMTDQTIRQIYHFFSDNSSCLRRSVWEKYPFPDVSFAEDQIWAKTIIEAGFKKAFARNSLVKHSHSFGPIETLRRSFDEILCFSSIIWLSTVRQSTALLRTTHLHTVT